MDKPTTKSAKKNAARAAKRRAARDSETEGGVRGGASGPASASGPSGADQDSARGVTAATHGSRASANINCAPPTRHPHSAAGAADAHYPPSLVDIGINISSRDAKGQWKEMLDRAVAVGVSSVVLTGVDLKSIRHNVAAATAYQGRAQLRCTAGVHPHHSTGGMTPTILAELRKHLAHPQVAAVGECGLDFNRKLSPHPDQISMFEGQLALAVELRMPVFCHVRDADQAALEVLDRYAGRLPPVVIHCFTGTAADARAYLDRGFFIGFTGTVCKFERGRHLRELLPGVPLDRIMLETDTPYMGFVKGRRHSEPADTVGVAQKIAEVKGVPFEEVCRVTTATADAFFGFHAPHTY